MARRGRKRAEGMDRFPGGQIRSDPRVREVGEFQRMKQMVSAGALHPAWVSELWRRAHLGEIDNTLKNAGDMWAKLVTEHRRLCLGSPAVGPKVSRYERGAGMSEIDIDALNPKAKEQLENYQDSISKRYDRAFCAVVDRHNGVNMMKAVNDLCLDNSAQDYSQFLLAKDGLIILAHHFGLRGRTKRA